MTAELSAAMRDIIAERRRQVEVEGWTREHDDEHIDGSMAIAASCYAAPPHMRDIRPGEIVGYTVIGPKPRMWPWSAHWWKPKDRRRDLVRAAALIVAEIERLDRLDPLIKTAVSPPSPEGGRASARLVQWRRPWEGAAIHDAGEAS